MFKFTVDYLLIVQMLIGVFLPILVGLVTKVVTSGAVKAWLLAGFNLLNAVLVGLAGALANGTTFDVGLALLATIPTFAISVATYYGFWKPTGIAQKAQEAFDDEGML